jgi:hypothetical protein
MLSMLNYQCKWFLLSLEIGTGTVVSGSFREWWSSNSYFIKQETINIWKQYTITGTSQLISVPYALYMQDCKYGVE